MPARRTSTSSSSGLRARCASSSAAAPRRSRQLVLEELRGAEPREPLLRLRHGRRRKPAQRVDRVGPALARRARLGQQPERRHVLRIERQQLLERGDRLRLLARGAQHERAFVAELEPACRVVLEPSCAARSARAARASSRRAASRSCSHANARSALGLRLERLARSSARRPALWPGLVLAQRRGLLEQRGALPALRGLRHAARLRRRRARTRRARARSPT